MTEGEMVEWRHQFNGHELGQTLGDSVGHGNLACCSPWGHKESDTTERLNNNNNSIIENPEIKQSTAAAAKSL